MSRRTTTPEERDLFAKSFAESRPLLKSALDVPQPKTSARVVEGGTGIDGNTEERLRRGQIDPEARLDLHGLTESVAHRTLLTFLKGAMARRHKLVLVVTGKGRSQAEDAPFDMELNMRSRGILKAAVPRWLNEKEFAGLVAGTRAAHKKHGGEGAMYIYLRKGR